MIFVASGSPPNLPIRRNTIILAATMAVNSAVLQLTAAVSSLTFVLVTGVRGLLGLGPAIFLTSSGLTAVPAARLGELVRRPGVRSAMLAALASFGVMVSVMNLSGYVVVEHHHHSQGSVFPIIGAHVFGMYALVLVIGALIDRVGRVLP